MKDYDVIVIGAGPGGYVAAIRAAQLGLKTACVDKWSDAKGKASPGGTCLNVGCIPSKALLDSSHHYHDVTHLLPAHGINTESVSLDLGAMMARKDKVVQNLTRGVLGLFRKNKIDFVHGSATLAGDQVVNVAGADGEQTQLRGTNIILASGSVPIAIDAAPVDGEHIVDNEGALAFDAVPPKLGIIGAGVIGLELGSVWNRLGSEVTILEAMESFLPAADAAIAKDAAKLFRKQGLDIRLGCKVTATRVNEGTVVVRYDDEEGARTLEVDRLVVAVGRRAYTDGLGLEAAGVALDERGRIAVDANCRTGQAGIWAVGDATAGPMLAHKASEEGIAVAEMIAGQSAHIDHALVPWVIYTHPEIAWVGRTAEQLKADGVEFTSGSFPFAAIGRAQGAGITDGSVRVYACAKTDRILGAHILGSNASELIAEAVTAMAFHGSAEDLARTVHAHPTLSEALHEAALAAGSGAIHI
ncbi:MAG: dihydrolipoyl dehydrogenase [Pseudomonadota bacterium]